MIVILFCVRLEHLIPRAGVFTPLVVLAKSGSREQQVVAMGCMWALAHGNANNKVLPLLISLREFDLVLKCTCEPLPSAVSIANTTTNFGSHRHACGQQELSQSSQPSSKSRSVSTKTQQYIYLHVYSSI
jgi:hypothetical protein